jgi:hypothetical protein
MGTMLPIAIWDFAGWTEEFWRIHRWPIKIICGTIYSLVQLLNGLLMTILIILFAIGYGAAVNFTMQKSWEFGITQSWNKIDKRLEGGLDNAVTHDTHVDPVLLLKPPPEPDPHQDDHEDDDVDAPKTVVFKDD